jgi:hypothetical protein
MKNIPAFPLEVIYTQENEKFNGMTLRDYFAAKAMQALIQFEDQALPYESRNTKDFDDRVSYQAYRYADAMMKVREA